MMIPIPSGQGPFLPPAPSTLPASPAFHFGPQEFKLAPPAPSIPPLPVFRYEPINLKLPISPPSIQLPSPPDFRFDPKRFDFSTPPPHLLKLTNPIFSSPPRALEWNSTPYKPREISPLEQKVWSVFGLTFIWICTAFTVSAIAREKAFSKKHEISMAVIGATTITVLTYVNVPIGLTCMAIILLIGAYICRESLSSPAHRDLNYRIPFNLPNPPLNHLLFGQNVAPGFQFHPVLPVIPPVNFVPLIPPIPSGATGG